MARIRTIKPEFWTDEKLTECSLSARLLFIGLLNFADDNGNLTRSSKKIKMQVFPADTIDCEPLLDELFTHGVLTEYSVSENKYINIKGFNKHQLINRPSSTTIPKPVFSESSVSPQGVLTTVREGRGGESKGREGSKALPNGKQSRKQKIPIPENFNVSDRVKNWATEKGHARLPERLEHFVSKAKSNGYAYVDWDEAFMGAIRDDWAKLPNTTGSNSGMRPAL